MHKILEEIYAERQRQIAGHGFDAAHDDQHSDGSLALLAETILNDFPLGDNQRWVVKASDKLEAKHDYRQLLVIASALIVAEIERWDRSIEARAQQLATPTPISNDMQQLADASRVVGEYRQD